MLLCYYVPFVMCKYFMLVRLSYVVDVDSLNGFNLIETVMKNTID